MAAHATSYFRKSPGVLQETRRRFIQPKIVNVSFWDADSPKSWSDWDYQNQ
jgi:hypothetical protein